MLLLIQGIFTMQQDQKLQTVFEAFASDLQAYIIMEVQRQVSAAMMASNSTTAQKNVSSRINMDVLDQLREEIVDTDSFSEEKLNALREISLKNVKKTSDVVSNSQAVDLSSLMGNDPEESDNFDSSKLDFLLNTKGVGNQSSSVVQEGKIENKYTPGFAGLRQLLSRVRKKSI